MSPHVRSMPPAASFKVQQSMVSGLMQLVQLLMLARVQLSCGPLTLRTCRLHSSRAERTCCRYCAACNLGLHVSWEAVTGYAGTRGQACTLVPACHISASVIITSCHMVCCLVFHSDSGANLLQVAKNWFFSFFGNIAGSLIVVWCAHFCFIV